MILIIFYLITFVLQMRAVSWRLLSKYLPPAGDRRDAVLESKRQGYQDLRHNYFRVDSQDESQQDTYRQVGNFSCENSNLTAVTIFNFMNIRCEFSL